MNHPRVTICMPTFGRPELLEEAVEGFLRQTWPNKRLIIGNDYADQTLVFDHPLVAIVNRAERFKTLGDKRNWLMVLAGENYIGHWDDDDLYLPEHIERVMGQMHLYSAEAARQHHQWYDHKRPKFRVAFASYMHTVIAHRSVFREAGDYGALNMNEDSEILTRLLRKKLLSGPAQALHEPTFIQRCGGERSHMTDFGDACFEKMAEEVKAQGRSGVIELRPAWRDDYLTKHRASWAAVQEASACQV